MSVSKSIPYVKGKPVNSLAKPITSMSGDDVSALRAELVKIRAKRAEKKKPTGPLHFPGNPSKRPQKSKADYYSELKAKRKADYDARQVAQESAPAEAPPALEKNKYISGRLVANTAASLSVAGSTAGIIHHRNVNKRDNTNAVLGATGGVAGANAVYNTGGWAAKRGIESKRKSIEANATPAQRKEWNRIWNDHKKAHGVEQTNSAMSHEARQKFYESYPKELPMSRATRALAVKNRRSVYGATLATGASIGAAMGAHSGQVSKGTNIREFPYLSENFREWTYSSPRIRSNPVSPVQMLSSGMMMAEAQAAGYGRKLSSKEKKAIGRSIRDYGEGRMFIYSPLGRGSVMT